MSRPRAADDFAAIRARMEELRRERERINRERAREEWLREVHQAALNRALGVVDPPKSLGSR
jgi:hypothetical protein